MHGGDGVHGGWCMRRDVACGGRDAHGGMAHIGRCCAWGDVGNIIPTIWVHFASLGK